MASKTRTIVLNDLSDYGEVKAALEDLNMSYVEKRNALIVNDCFQMTEWNRGEQTGFKLSYTRDPELDEAVKEVIAQIRMAYNGKSVQIKSEPEPQIEEKDELPELEPESQPVVQRVDPVRSVKMALVDATAENARLKAKLSETQRELIVARRQLKDEKESTGISTVKEITNPNVPHKADPGILLPDPNVDQKGRQTRKVDKSGRISFKSKRYEVGKGFTGDTIQVESFGEELHATLPNGTVMTFPIQE